MGQNTHHQFGYGGRSQSSGQSTTRELEKLTRILVTDPSKPAIPKTEPHGGQLEYSKRTSSESLQNSLDAENIQQLLPDVIKAKQILVSTILAPKDLITVNPIFKCESPHLGEVATDLLRAVEDELVDVYKIKQKMVRHLESMLFDYGAYVSVIIPKSRIDSIINSDRGYSNESYEEVRSGRMFQKSMGILGDPDFSSRRQMSMESLYGAPVKPWVGTQDDFNIMVTDNPDAFKMGEVMKRWSEKRIEEAYEINRSFSLEDRGLKIDPAHKRRVEKEKKDKRSDGKLFQTRWYDRKLVLDIDEATKEDEQYDYDDTPLELNIPVEAWVPVHAPSDPSVILGGFALCDQYGSPVHRGTVKDFYQQLNQGMSPTSGAHSQMLGRMRSTLLDYGYRAGNGTNDADAMLRMFTGIVEEDIKRRLKNGVSGDTATLSSNDEIYRIMFARACAQMQTQLIYIPKRFMTYFTFDVDEKGVGRSLLTLTKTMSSIRATVDMANFFATVRNSTNYRKYTLELNENDPDPDDTVETTIHEISRSTQQNMPMFEPNPADIVNFIQNAGISIEVTGHPRWASTKIDMQNQQASNVTVDTDFVDRLQNNHMAAIGVPAEAVNASMDVEFMRNVIQNHLLFTKGAMRYQEDYTPQLTDNARKYISANGRLLNKLVEIVHEKRDILRKAGIMDSNSDRDIVNHFVNNFLIELPAPDLTKIDVQMEEFDKFNEALEKFLPSFISSDIMGSDTAIQLGELGGSVDNMVAIIKAYLQRKWLSEHGVMPELFDIVAETSEDNPVSEIADAHLLHRRGLVKLILPLVTKLTKENEQVRSIMEKLGAEEEGGDDNSDDSSDDNTDDSDENDEDAPSDEFGSGNDDGGGDDLGGFDDFESDNGDGEEEGSDDDGSGDDESPDEDEPSDENEDDDKGSDGTSGKDEDDKPEEKEEPEKEEKVKEEPKEDEKEKDDDLGGFKG